MFNVASVLHRAWRIYPDFVLGTGHEVFSKTLKETVKGRAKDVNYFSSVWNGIKKGAKAAEDNNIKNVEKHGSFLKSLWNDLKTTPNLVKDGWTNAATAAEKAGKTGISKYWAQFKGAGSGLMKRMPLIGSLLIVAFELPNIFRATKDEGLVSGAAEVVKAGLRLGAGMTGAAIGQALIPIPILGGLVGFIAGDKLMSFVTGKSYTEKKEENEQIAMQAAEQNIPQELAQNGDLTQNIPFGNLSANAQNTIPQATLTQQQVAALGQQLYAGAGLKDSMNEDFMASVSGMNKLNYVG